MDEFEKMHNGEIYSSIDPNILKKQEECLELQYEFNQTRPSETQKRKELLKKMFNSIGENCHIEPPLHANWAGHFVSLGNNVYINFHLTLVDDTYIDIGDYTMIGPNVTLAAGTHPISPQLRQKASQYNLPIHIGKNVWLGAGVIVLPGVSIGDNSIIGAGSIVTKDIPANVIAVGNPCHILRSITKEDEENKNGYKQKDYKTKKMEI